jgi:hypothetical protein
MKNRILDAHRRGDTVELERLQAEYRNTPGRMIDSAERGYATTPIQVVEPVGIERARRRPQPKRGRRVDLQPGFFDFRRVVVRDRCRDEMLGEIARWNDSLAYPARGIESGGFLAGYWEDDRIVLTRASGPGPNVKNGHDFLKVTLDAGYELERQLEPYERLFGHWHVHVGAGQTKPSTHDLDAWAGLSDRFASVPFVAEARTSQPGPTPGHDRQAVAGESAHEPGEVAGHNDEDDADQVRAMTLRPGRRVAFVRLPAEARKVGT